MTTTEADAAALRIAFNKAAESYPMAYVMPEPVRLWWAGFYAAIRDHEAGLRLLAELQRLREKAGEL